jgi:hypothetical protein
MGFWTHESGELGIGRFGDWESEASVESVEFGDRGIGESGRWATFEVSSSTFRIVPTLPYTSDS